MPILNNTKNLVKEIKIKEKELLFTNEYISILNEKKTKGLLSSVSNVEASNKQMITSDLNNKKNSGIFQYFTDAFSLKNQIQKKLNSPYYSSSSSSSSSVLSQFNTISIDKTIQEIDSILGVNINDPIIDYEYIEQCFQGSKLDELLSQISEEFRGTEHQQLILDDYRNNLVLMFEALNSDKIDVEFIKKSFVNMYSNTNIYNGQLRGQKIRHDILMFQQAFNRSPKKFKLLEDLIPVNLGTSVDVVGIAEPRIICHSIGGLITSDSLKFSHEILISRAISAKFNLKLFVKLDQSDAEISAVLDFFSKIGHLSQLNSDVVFLDEDNMTFSEWDIKNEFIRLVISRKFQQHVVQLGNFPDELSKERFASNYLLDLLRDFERKLNKSNLSLEQRAILLKRHAELVSYFFSRDPLLLVSSGNKSFFSSVKIFLDITSYKQK